MKIERFRLALRELKPSDWERFEQLASIYLASEFPTLRTLATSSGDSGRDGTLFAPEGDEVVFQYSISQDWRQKIRRTVKRLNQKFPGSVRVLVYVSNCRIGADADEFKLELQQRNRIHLDVRDANWFIERVNSNADRQEAAEELARVVVDPLLAGDDIIARKAQALTGAEARTGLLYLALQWKDVTREKGLTKLSYEALVKAALRGTSSTHRLTRQEVHDRVTAIIPMQDRASLNQHVNSALARMTKKTVRHWMQADEFCLTFEEQQRVNDRHAELELEDGDFETETRVVVGAVADALNIDLIDKLPELGVRVKLLLDRFVLNRGEAFASAVVSGDLRRLDMEDLKDLVIADVGNFGDAGLGGGIIDLLTNTLEEVIWSGGPAVQSYLRRSTDTYTLLAFLRETPDVQQVVEKLFSHGSVWLDTSIVLPAMAETLLDEERQRFSRLLRIARDAGLDLRITPGVLEEVERHLNRSMSCLHAQESWEGRTPFLLAMYAASGQPVSDFPCWTEQFAGTARPEDDIADYLYEGFGIDVESLEADANNADVNLRGAVQEVWQVAHERRRSREVDPITIGRLISHDVENYVGVIARRNHERDSPFGYTNWWLTLDPTAFILRRVLMEQLEGRAPDSPVLSPDFLATYLAIGPMRRNVSKDAEQYLPVLLDLGVQEVPADLLAVANAVRIEATGRSEQLIRRTVRDEIDRAKRRQGPIAQKGLAGLEKHIKEQLAENRRERSRN